MNIATYNLRQGGTSKNHWLKLIEQFSIDLLLVQESFSPDEHLPSSSHPTSRAQSAWQPIAGNSWGSAVYSSTGSVRPVAPMEGFAGWVTGAEIMGAHWQHEAESILVYSIHAPKISGSYHAAVNQILDGIAKSAEDRPLILGGDFNLTVSEPSPTCRPASKHEVAIHARLREEFGLVNCWSIANPGAALAQTLRWNRNREIQYHCDGIFVPKTWGARLRKCFVVEGDEWTLISDHNPVVAIFD